MPGPPVVDLRNSFGAVFIGLVLCVVLFGLALAQTWVYFWYLVLNFGNVEALALNKWFFIVQGNVGCLQLAIVLTKRRYYARQIYLVSRNIISPILIVSMSIIGNASSFYVMAIELAGGKVAGRFGDVEWMGIFSSADCMVIDLLIVGLMSQALRRQKTGFARTDSIIKTLMAYTINTGLWTTLFAASMTASVGDFSHFLKQLPVGHCTQVSNPDGNLPPYGKMLNSRGYVRNRGSPDNLDISFNLSSIRVAPPSEAFGSKSTDFSVTVRRSTALVDAQNGFDPNLRHTFEVLKLVR
ncbi:hypothetical protein V8E53_006868 [Lactarius tabidus]